MSPDAAGPIVGLCTTCQHGRVVRSARGSVFWRCARAANDHRFRKYPSLPVERCEGFEAGSLGKRDRFTMGPALATKAAEMIRPKVAIPIHYATWPLLVKDATEFIPQGMEVRAMSPGESWSFG